MSAPGGEYQPDSLTVTRRIALQGMRGAITRRVNAGYAIPNTTLHTSGDFTEAVELQRRLVSDWRPHRIRPQYQDLVIAALAAALVEFPEANSHLVDNTLHLIGEVNIGVAVAVGDGLMVPVVRNAHERSLLEIAMELRNLVRAAKGSKMSATSVSGGTFTVSSLTGYGIDRFSPIINPPETNVLGVGRVEQLPRYVEGELQPRWIGHLSLSFDHRAWDGAPAGRFLHSIVSRLRSPAWMAS